MTQTTPTKRDIAEALLERGSVFLHLDPRAEGVHVPPFLRAQSQVVLQVGWNMPIPIRDLRIDEEGVTATLSFNRTPHLCFVPWDAIFALVGDDGKGRVFLESMPPEIQREIDRESGDDDDDCDEREPMSAELDAIETDDEPERDGNVIPLWPRSVKPGAAASAAKLSSSAKPSRSASSSKTVPATPPAAPAPTGVVGAVGGPRRPTLPPPSPEALRVSSATRPPRPKVSPEAPVSEKAPESADEPPTKPRPPHPHLRRVK